MYGQNAYVRSANPYGYGGRPGYPPGAYPGQGQYGGYQQYPGPYGGGMPPVHHRYARDEIIIVSEDKVMAVKLVPPRDSDTVSISGSTLSGSTTMVGSVM